MSVEGKGIWEGGGRVGLKVGRGDKLKNFEDKGLNSGSGVC